MLTFQELDDYGIKNLNTVYDPNTFKPTITILFFNGQEIKIDCNMTDIIDIADFTRKTIINKLIIDKRREKIIKLNERLLNG